MLHVITTAAERRRARYQLPALTRRPAIAGGVRRVDGTWYENVTWYDTVRYSTVTTSGMILFAQPGQWAGDPPVIREWIDAFTGEVLPTPPREVQAAEFGLDESSFDLYLPVTDAFLPTQQRIYGIQYRERVVGTDLVAESTALVEIVDPPPPPTFSYCSSAVVSSSGNGIPYGRVQLTKPTFVWQSDLPIIQRAGTWMRSFYGAPFTDFMGDAIEVDASNFWGSVVLSWKETVTDLLGREVTLGPADARLDPTLHVDAALAYLYLGNDSVRTVETANESVMRRVNTSPTATSAATDLFSNLQWPDPGNYSAFVPNVEFWAPDLRTQLTGVSMKNGAWNQSYGPTMLTPRHAICCGHNGPGEGTTVRFVSADGTQIFDTYILKWVNDFKTDGVHYNSGSSVPHGTYSTTIDLSIYLLAHEVPEWVHKMPVLSVSRFKLDAIVRQNPLSVAVSQGNSGPSNYPTRPDTWTPRGRKLYVKRLALTPDADPALSGFQRGVYVGDSGTPEFLLMDNELVLVRIITGSTGAGVYPALHVGTLEDYIKRADSAAGIDTGYRINWVEPDGYNQTVLGDSPTGRALRYAREGVACITPRILAADAAEESMPMFKNGTNPNTGVFVPNEKLWIDDLRAQLTGVHQQVSHGWGPSYGITAITPRHAINCAHNGPGPGGQITYVNVDGSTFITTIQQVSLYLPGGKNGVDLAIYLLADEYPEWVYKAPIIDRPVINPISRYEDVDLPYHGIVVSQGVLNEEFAKIRKVYVNQGLLFSDSIFAPFRHGVFVGDSGTPCFDILADQLYLRHIVSGDIPSLHIPRLNQLIGMVDSAAGISTGYTLQPFQNGGVGYYSYEERVLNQFP